MWEKYQLGTLILICILAIAVCALTIIIMLHS